MSDADISPPEPTAADIPPADAPALPRVHWDDTGMVTTFANAVNVVGTREELNILFGANQTWNAAELRELTIHLSNRIVLNPHAAKRLLILLGTRMREYEQRFGPVNL